MAKKNLRVARGDTTSHFLVLMIVFFDPSFSFYLSRDAFYDTVHWTTSFRCVLYCFT